MGNLTAKITVSAKCPRCGLSAKGSLTMNKQAMEWFDAAWKQHLQECRAKASLKPAQEG